MAGGNRKSRQAHHRRRSSLNRAAGDGVSRLICCSIVSVLLFCFSSPADCYGVRLQQRKGILFSSFFFFVLLLGIDTIINISMMTKLIGRLLVVCSSKRLSALYQLWCKWPRKRKKEKLKILIYERGERRKKKRSNSTGCLAAQSQWLGSMLTAPQTRLSTAGSRRA